jgi:hypothetical protein
MWICSQLGFYSIVRKDDGWHVRARTLRDINNLIQAAGLAAPVQRWPTADYRFRILVEETAVSKIFECLAQSIDYPNFKNRIHDLPDQRAKLIAYSNLWREMFKIQERGE